MFSGKSTALINIANDLIESGANAEKDIIVVNHKSDNRFSDKEYIISHD
jgi:thymidine kinase